MGMFDSLNVSASGMTATQLWMDVVSSNLANADSTTAANGQPYRRKEIVLSEASPSFGEVLGGVQVKGIVNDPSPLRQVYDPGNPQANKQGYVSMPNVNPVTEMVDLISASRGYESNVTAMNAAKQMFSKTFDVLR
jgi:flagellar basal-body rod protein FlgC